MYLLISPEHNLWPLSGRRNSYLVINSLVESIQPLSCGVGGGGGPALPNPQGCEGITDRPHWGAAACREETPSSSPFSLHVGIYRNSAVLSVQAQRDVSPTDSLYPHTTRALLDLELQGMLILENGPTTPLSPLSPPTPPPLSS